MDAAAAVPAAEVVVAIAPTSYGASWAPGAERRLRKLLPRLLAAEMLSFASAVACSTALATWLVVAALDSWAPSYY